MTKMPPAGLSIGAGTAPFLAAPLLAARVVAAEDHGDRSTVAENTTTPPWLFLSRPANPNEWNGASVVPVAALSAFVAVAFVYMRFYTRARLLRSVEWDDWTILASLVFAVATSIGMMTQLKFGLGQHLYYT